MSVFFKDEMDAVGKDVQALLKWWNRRAAVFEFTVGELRMKGEEVWREPISDFPGHGAVRR
ncbi:MAG: hypothetical protein ACRD4I_00220, partial [Candidatus Angelobacter sp.]